MKLTSMTLTLTAVVTAPRELAARSTPAAAAPESGATFSSQMMARRHLRSEDNQAELFADIAIHAGVEEIANENRSPVGDDVAGKLGKDSQIIPGKISSHSDRHVVLPQTGGQQNLITYPHNATSSTASLSRPAGLTNTKFD